MRAISGKDLARILEKHGWKLARVKGSHRVYVKEGRLERLSLPIHGNRALKLGLLKHFLKLAGLKEADLTEQKP